MPHSCVDGIAGVFGRATELAKVTQRKYNLAMAVVMGKDMDSVICDTEATAKECIHWLRQNQVAPMTFFPLDTVRAKVCIPDKKFGPVLLAHFCLAYGCILVLVQHCASTGIKCFWIP